MSISSEAITDRQKDVEKDYRIYILIEESPPKT